MAATSSRSAYAIKPTLISFTNLSAAFKWKMHDNFIRFCELDRDGGLPRLKR